MLASGTAGAAEIKVLSTQATQAAYEELVAAVREGNRPQGRDLLLRHRQRLQEARDGETYDLVIMSAPAIDTQIKNGKVATGSRVDFASSGTGLAVEKGAPKPDISSGDALKKTLIAAKSIGYSTGPSGVYVIGMFEKLGIADQVKGKLKQTPSGGFVGTLIASGDAEIGFQQDSELVHIPGIDFVGPLPPDVQNITMFSAGLHSAAKEVDAAKALVKFLTAPAAAAVIKKHGLEPG